MAKSRDSSSSEESEEEQTSSEGSESESESEQPQVNKKSIPVPVSTIKSEPQPSNMQSQLVDSSSDDESDSKSNSDSPINKPDSTVKLPSNASGTPTMVGAKRPFAISVTRQSKRLKKNSRKTEVEVSEDKGVDSKKKSKMEVEGSEDRRLKPFHRLWSEDDEMAILQGIIDYRAKKKTDPITDLNDFHAFIKKSINIEVSKTQLQAKMRRLKKKYENNSSKETKGKEKAFSKAHEQSVYKLSEKVWGHNELGLGGVKREEVTKDTHTCCWIEKEGWKMMKGEKREEMEKKRKKLRLKEIAVYRENLKFKLEYAEVVFEAMNSD